MLQFSRTKCIINKIESYMLIDQHDPDIFAFRREAIERSLDGRIVRLAIDDKKVLFGFWWWSDMLFQTSS